MDQAVLVDVQLDDGRALLDALGRNGLEVTAACWLKQSDNRRWHLHIALRNANRANLAEMEFAAEEICQQQPFPRLALSEFKVISAEHPIATHAQQVQRERSETALLRLRVPFFGGEEVEEVCIYPRLNPTRSPVVRTRISGVQAHSNSEEEIACVEGLPGEEAFHRRFAELIQTRFGGAEQFQEMYPRLIFQKVSA